MGSTLLVYSSMSLVTHSSSDYTALYGFLGDGTTTGEAVEGGVVPVGAECVDGEHVVSCSRLLLEGGAELTATSGAMQITSTGFQFLLHSPHDQLWDLLLQYLHLAQVCWALCMRAS